MRYYTEQRTWLLGAELTGDWQRTELKTLELNGLIQGATATVSPDREYFSGEFFEAAECDHLRIDFHPAAAAQLRRRIACEGLNLVEMIPRISKHGYLSLTSVFTIEDWVKLQEIESKGVELSRKIDEQFGARNACGLLDELCSALERSRVLEFPFRYRFGVPEALKDSAHDELYAYSFNQHILLPDVDQLKPAARTMGLDPSAMLTIEEFRVVSGWSVFVWAPKDREPANWLVRFKQLVKLDNVPAKDREPAKEHLARFKQLVTLDNVLAVQLTVLACGLSAMTAFLGKILRDDRFITAWSVRDMSLVHHRIEQSMKLRERELLEDQKKYVREQLKRSDYPNLREAYDRAETALISAAEGLEAARQQETSAVTNVILCLAAVLGALTVFTAAVDFADWADWMPMERPFGAGVRRGWLTGVALLVFVAALYASKGILRASELPGRRRSIGRASTLSRVINLLLGATIGGMVGLVVTSLLPSEPRVLQWLIAIGMISLGGALGSRRTDATDAEAPSSRSSSPQPRIRVRSSLFCSLRADRSRSR